MPCSCLLFYSFKDTRVKSIMTSTYTQLRSAVVVILRWYYFWTSSTTSLITIVIDRHSDYCTVTRLQHSCQPICKEINQGSLKVHWHAMPCFGLCTLHYRISKSWWQELKRECGEHICSTYYVVFVQLDK